MDKKRGKERKEMLPTRIQSIKVQRSFSCKCLRQKCPPITLVLLFDQMMTMSLGRSQFLQRGHSAYVQVFNSYQKLAIVKLIEREKLTFSLILPSDFGKSLIPSSIAASHRPHIISNPANNTWSWTQRQNMAGNHYIHRQKTTRMQVFCKHFGENLRN